jgi:hypothetical protein
MAHFAKLDENNTVVQVIVVHNNELLDENGVEQESLGVAFCQSLFGLDTTWKQTSYNDNFIIRYASVGFTYDPSLNSFIPPKPFESWVLDESKADWVAPLDYPALTQEQFDAGSFYYWNEDDYQTDNNTGWVLRTISRPFPSWIREDNPKIISWLPPIDIPQLTEEQIQEGYSYRWDEDAYQADNTSGWVLIEPTE